MHDETPPTLPAASTAPDASTTPTPRARRRILPDVRLSRRTWLLGVSSALGAGAVTAVYRPAEEIGLYSQTVAFTAPGERLLIHDPAALRPGTRVATRGAPALVLAEQDWLDQLDPWTQDAGRHTDLLRQALLDIHVLSEGLPAPVAGWSPQWRYVWPRDVAHVALALHAVGDSDRAVEALAFFRTVHRPGGLFEARYLPDGSGSPDERTPQFDGLGWVLWAAGRIHSTGSPTVQRRVETELGPLCAELAAYVCDRLGENDGLPPVSPDYWEHAESRLTLGTVGPTLAGLVSTSTLWTALGSEDLGTRVREAAEVLQKQTVRLFGGTGYQRYAASGGADSAMAFLLPPYNSQFDRGAVEELLEDAWRRMARPAGGIAPGEKWKDDGISWTPETSMFALTHAHLGHHHRAHQILDWLTAHRTATGTLPEKVLYDGRPAAVAPLAWTAANVVLALDALRR